MMNLPLFYVAELKAGEKQLELAEETTRHIVQVLRMKVGDGIFLTNGKGLQAEAEIQSTSKRSCTVTIKAEVFFPVRTSTICIAISPVKNIARFEWFLEKAAELGVAKIVPLITRRTERQHYKAERWNAILISAMQQSRQYWLTDLADPIAFESFVKESTASHKFIAHCLSSEKPELQTLSWKDQATLLIGPEGDFTADEVQYAIASGYKEVSLGETRLRTETAALTAAVLLTHR